MTLKTDQLSHPVSFTPHDGALTMRLTHEYTEYTDDKTALFERTQRILAACQAVRYRSYQRGEAATKVA